MDNKSCVLQETKIAVMDEKIKEISTRIGGMEWMRDSLIKMTTLMEITQEDSKKKAELMEQQTGLLLEQSHALIKVNDNLSSLNEEMTSIRNQVKDLEQKIEENELNTLREGSINTVGIIKKLLESIILGGLGGSVVYYILKGFGAK